MISIRLSFRMSLNTNGNLTLSVIWLESRDDELSHVCESVENKCFVLLNDGTFADISDITLGHIGHIGYIGKNHCQMCNRNDNRDI
jgi:hypothetical protein